MRLIDADELVKALDEASKERTDLMDTLRKQLLVGFAKQVLSDAPTVDVVPVKQGHWAHGREVSRDYVGDVCVSVYYDKWWCSECNYHVEGYPLWKYCPCCGAKMDENE